MDDATEQNADIDPGLRPLIDLAIDDLAARLDVVMMADLTAAALQSGCSSSSSAIRPATWGLDIEVP